VFALASCALYLAIGPAIVDAMTTSEEVRAAARDFLIYAALLLLCGLAVYLLAWWGLRGLGNHGLWLAFLAFLIARGAFQALRLPALERRTFGA